MNKNIIIFFISVLCCCKGVKNDYQNFNKLLGYNVSYWSDDFGELEDGTIVRVERIFPASVYAFGYCGVFVETHLNDAEYNFNKKLLTEIGLFESYLYDGCNFFITEESNDNCLKKYPLPDFWNGVKGPFSRQKYPLDSLSQFIAVETGEGLYLKDEFLKGRNLEALIEHGFSSGVLTNPTYNSITYWTIVW